MTPMRQVPHDEAVELAALYVLGALEPAEHEAVREHLAGCSEAHPEFEELGGAAQALATLVDPVAVPPELRSRVLSAIGAEATISMEPARAWVAPRPVSRPMRIPAARPSFRWPAWLGWAAAGAAVLVLAVIGVWGVGLQARTDELVARNALVADALEARSSEGAQVATLSGSGAATGATGFAAFTAGGEGYIMLVGLPPAPAGRTYQAWYLVDGQPYSAGVLDVGDDGIALLSDVEPRTGTNLIALTIEQSGGADQPTSDPIVAGELTA